jgi:glycosyltransferase involved in cell wall biosynthesis
MKSASTTSVVPAHRLSVVIPMLDEDSNVRPLVERVHAALRDYRQGWELILVDDGSQDGTWEAIAACSEEFGEHVRGIRLLRNFRQTAAMQAGIDYARGDVIATLDGDLQNDPADIPAMVAQLLGDDLDCVTGWRKDRKDGWFLRRLPSVLANNLIRRATGIRVHDVGCSLKVFRAPVLRRIRLYGEMHRFIPAWLATVTSPRRIGEFVVRHHARTRGISKYGLMRTFGVVLDLLTVWYFMRFRSRPGHFFGNIGLLLLTAGGVPLLYLLVLKLMGEPIGSRPLLLAGIVLVLAGVQFLTTGILAELLTRTWYESRAARPYEIAEAAEAGADEHWRAG